MRSFTPAIVVCVVGVLLVVGSAIDLTTSPQWSGDRHAKRSAMVAVLPVIPGPPAAVSFSGESLPTASPGVSLERGGQAT